MFILYRINRNLMWVKVWNGQDWDDNPHNAHLFEDHVQAYEVYRLHTIERNQYSCSIQEVDQLPAPKDFP